MSKQIPMSNFQSDNPAFGWLVFILFFRDSVTCCLSGAISAAPASRKSKFQTSKQTQISKSKTVNVALGCF
jgi:hypothetical protein